MSQPVRQMSTKVQSGGGRLVVGIKFVFCAVPGLFVFLAFSFVLIDQLLDPQDKAPHPFVTAGLAALGLVLILFGLGRWSQWRYALVFVSLPVSVWLYSLLNITLVDPKLDAGLVAAIVGFLTYYIMKRSYGKAV